MVLKKQNGNTFLESQTVQGFFFFFSLAKQEEIGKKHMDSGWAYDVFSTWVGTLLIFVVWLKINFGEAFKLEEEKNPYLGLNQHLWHLINHCLM